jgi:hypothetical protein
MTRRKRPRSRKQPLSSATLRHRAYLEEQKEQAERDRLSKYMNVLAAKAEREMAASAERIDRQGRRHD